MFQKWTEAKQKKRARASRSHRRRSGDLSNWPYEETVAALAAALELRDDKTGGHAHRVTALALALAREVTPHMAEDPRLRFGFLLHDIGKIGIPDAILLKPGPLTEGEQRLMEQHTILGEHLIARVPHLHEIARDVILHHHECWDGSGYPWGLAGADIPLPARVFALADAFDAMVNNRPYQRAREIDDALEEIVRQSGHQFDPELVPPFVRIARELYGERPDSIVASRSPQASAVPRVRPRAGLPDHAATEQVVSEALH